MGVSKIVCNTVLGLVNNNIKTTFKGHQHMIKAVASRLKKVYVGTPFEATVRAGETNQAPELSHFSTSRDNIWCVKVPDRC